MICTRRDCSNRINIKRTTRKFCSDKCRKAQFTDDHRTTKPNTEHIDGFTDAPQAPEPPKEIVRRIKGAKAYEKLSTGSKCGHPVIGGRCLQKSCYVAQKGNS